MTRLDYYRSALIAAFSDVSDKQLTDTLDNDGADFVSFIVDHGLGPLWHKRTGREEFRESRLSAEALYLAQEHALKGIDSELQGEGIEYALIKGAATRLSLYENPAIRACFDLDLLVCPEDRVRAAGALVDTGYVPSPAAHRIGVELLLAKGVVDVDLHWRLVREGRLRGDCTTEILGRRHRLGDTWVLNAEDTLFVLLVHPAFAKHLAGWEMGLHRVVDILDWLRTQSIDWQSVRVRLQQLGVKTAAWATLRWVQMLAHPHEPAELDALISDLSPGRLRSKWLEWWLRSDLPARLSNAHWLRLAGFSLFLHDSVGDAIRAVGGLLRARARSRAELDAFRELQDQ